MKTFTLSLLFIFLLSSCSKENEKSEINESPQEIPPTNDIVLGESTIQLTEQQISHISDMNENGELVFDNSTDKSILPSTGQILLISHSSTKFPNGFLGKVTDVILKDGEYTIKTEMATLDEAFDYLQVNTTVELVPQDVTQTRIAFTKDEDDYWIASQNLSWEQNKTNISGEVSMGFKLTICIDINRDKKKSYGYFILQSKMNVDADFGFDLKGELPKLEAPIGMPIPLTCSLSNILIKPVVQLYYVTKAEGSISTSAHFSYSAENSAAVAYNNGIWEAGSHATKQGKASFSFKYISLNGQLFSGIATSVEIRLFGMKDLKVALQPQLGTTLNGNFTLNSNSSYESLKDAQLKTSLGLKVDVEISPKVMNNHDDKFSASLFDIPFFEKAYYLLPDFTNIKVNTDIEHKTATPSCTVSRTVLFPVNIGWGLYSKDTPISASNILEYSDQEEFKNPLEHTFADLNYNDIYTVYPHVSIPNLLPITLAISEKKEFTLEEMLIGKWKLDSSIVISEGSMKGENVMHFSHSVIFQKDGTGYMIGEYINGHWDPNHRTNFTWEKTGNTIIFNNNKESFLKLLSLESNKFTTTSTLIEEGPNGQETSYKCLDTYLRIQ